MSLFTRACKSLNPFNFEHNDAPNMHRNIEVLFYNPDKFFDDKAVDMFAEAMKSRLAEKRMHGRGGWQHDSAESLSDLLIKQVEKGNPIDVANFACFLFNNHQKIVGTAPKTLVKILNEHIAELKQTRDVITKYNQSRGADGLLAALQAEAANDAPESDDDLLELGQWVFEGQDERWIGAAVDAHNHAWLFLRPLYASDANSETGRWNLTSRKIIPGRFNSDNWQQSFIDRYPVNDVDFEDTQSEEKETLESEFLGVNPTSGASADWHGVLEDEDNTPELSYDDLQHIFVQNLTNVLIQRMHSLERFSDDELTISLALAPWDVVTYWTDNVSIKRFAILTQPLDWNWLNKHIPRTIREDEIQEFREWAEAHYV